MLKNSAITELLEPAIRQLGFELWGVEFHTQGKHSQLRVYIEGQTEEASVTLDDCQRVSRQLSALLDVANIIRHAYRLEVSSPGMDRRLFTLEQCRRYIGKTIHVHLQTAINGQRNWSGQLQAVTDDLLCLNTENENSVTIPFTAVSKAKLEAAVMKAKRRGSR